MSVLRQTWALRKRVGPYLWFLPAFLVVFTIVIYPMLWALRLSFYSWNPIRQASPVYVGLRNYIELLGSHSFQEIILRTILLVVCSVGLEFLFGLGLALLLNSGVRGRSIYTTLYLIPMVLTPSIVALMWKPILHTEWGVLNYLLERIGISGKGWISDPSLTFITITVLTVWQNMAFVMLFMLAGLQSVPGEILDAAQVDGANLLQMLRSIILPWLAPLIAIALLFRVMFTLRTFDVVYGLWGSAGPVNRGMVLGIYLYERLKQTWHVGFSASVAYILLLLTAVLGIGFTISLFRRGEV